MTDVMDNAGNRTEYGFGCAEGWGVYEVVRFHSIEEISHPFKYDVVLLRRVEKGQPDLDALLDAWVTFRIAAAARWRVVHGVVVQAEEIERTRTFSLVRVVIMPPIARARHRRRCRNFVDKSLSDIFATVLENKSPAFPSGNQGLAKLSGAPAAPSTDPDWNSFNPPTGQYRLAITDTSRIDDATITPYVVQYNESDHDFLSRLLEKEGISYYF
jgi:type VI secretion system secreted protein VgrG